MSRLKGKTAVITGGSTGIGFETARHYLREGARVIITGQNEARLAEAGAKLGAGVKTVKADVRSLDDVAKLAETVKREFNSLDILFVNAGVATFSALEEVDESNFDYQFDTNVKGAFFTIQKLSGLFRQGSSIIINASTIHGKGRPQVSVYAATKAAVRSLARSLAAELGPRGIRVNTLSPGYVPTEIQGKAGLPPEAIEAFKQSVISSVPLGRTGGADEIARAAVFLASDDSSYITATDLPVDGGFLNV
ncbi:MAG TPA: SDR family oxidoreductase [Blastocatellia bacterium]|nr:SDR family oxidoreductase [Blastocatellia bacterium]